MNDDQRLLANAYLDGDVDAGERARAEADDEVMAEVARLGAVREALRSVDPPDPDRRAAAIAAAVAAFGEVRTPTTTTIDTAPSAPPAVQLASRRRRPSWLAPLAAAAAVVLVVGGGIAVVVRDGEGTQDDAGPADLALSAEAEEDAGAGDAGDAPQSEEGAVEATSAPAATLESASPDAATGSDEPASDGGATTDAALEVLRSPAELAAFVTRQRGSVRVVTAPACNEGELVGVATYRRDGQDVLVEVFTADGDAVAVDARDCRVVARADLP